MYVVRLKPALLEIRSMGSTKRTFLRPQGWKDPKKKAARIGNRLARRLCYLPGSKIVMVLNDKPIYQFTREVYFPKI